MPFTVDVELARTAELVEDPGEPAEVEMELDELDGVVRDSYGTPVEPVYKAVKVMAEAYHDYSVTLRLGGEPVVRASYDAYEEACRVLYSRGDPEPSFDDDDLLQDAPEWIDDPFLQTLFEEDLPRVVEEAGGSMTAEEIAGRFSDKWDKVEVLA